MDDTKIKNALSRVLSTLLKGFYETKRSTQALLRKHNLNWKVTRTVRFQSLRKRHELGSNPDCTFSIA